MLAVIRVSDIEPERASGPKNALDFGAYGYQVVDEVAVVIFEANARVGILALAVSTAWPLGRSRRD